MSIRHAELAQKLPVLGLVKSFAEEFFVIVFTKEFMLRSHRAAYHSQFGSRLQEYQLYGCAPWEQMVCPSRRLGFKVHAGFGV